MRARFASVHWRVRDSAESSKTCTTTTSWSTLGCRMDSRHVRFTGFHGAGRTLLRCESHRGRAYAMMRSATETPAPSCRSLSLTIDATHRIHLNFHSCSGSAQAATGPFTSARPPRAVNRAIPPLHRPWPSRCSPSATSRNSCNHPSFLPRSVARFPHDASHPREMSSPRFLPTTAPLQAPDS